MHPSSYPYDRKQLKAAWTTFVQSGALPATPLDPAVKRSWLTCREAGVDPEAIPQPEYLDAGALEARRESCFDLIAVARPFMEDVYQFSGESDMIVYLTDDPLYVIDWLGDAALASMLEKRGLQDGVRLTERQIGTNEAALTLNEGLPVQVVGAEHFCKALHFLTGAAAPIHEPAGQVVGVIGLVTLERNSHPHSLGIVMAAARAIENQLQADQSLAEAQRHLGELNASLQAMHKGIVFLDLDGVVNHVNASAGEILGISHRMATGRPLNSLIDLPSEVQETMAQRVSMAETEVVCRVDGEHRPCLMSLDVLERGSDLLGFILTLEHSAEARRLVHRMVGAQAHFTFEDIQGQSVKMRRVLYYARCMATGNSPVLLLGESGTGKEVFAQAIHNASAYSDGPFIAFDCAAIPRELMIGELFGYEGTWVTSQEGRPGKLELSDGGTVLFDHIDSMPYDVQGSLLRVIDTREISRLGGSRVISIDVRIIAASSNLELAGEVKAGRFRADFFYRLRAMTLTIPPLRERGNDVILLIADLTQKLAQDLGRSVRISPRAMAILQSYRWPGNVRELKNVLEWALHMADGSEITVEHLPEEVRSASIGGDGDEHVLTLQEAERQAIIHAGQALEGQVTRMAEALGIGRTTLWRKMKAYGLSADTFKRNGIDALKADAA
jgi:PAS domain S-box-containing protein